MAAADSLIEPCNAPPIPPAPPPTSLTAITFPRRQWATRDNRLTLALTATAQLVWPTTPSSSSNVFLAQTVPAARVAQLVRAGRLWIGTEGRSVRFGVKATLGGKSRIKSEQLEKLKELVADWPWSELGLALVAKTRGRRGQEDQDDLVFCHPSSPNGLYAPRGIPRARLERVDCQLRFSCCLDGFDLPAPMVTRGPEQKPPAGPALSKGKGQAKATGRNKARKPKAKPKPKPKPHKATKPPVRSLTDPKCLFEEDGTCRDRTCVIVEAALATFVGIKGRQVGARALDRQSLPSGAPSLLDVAPAVWSYPLFKAAASRAACVPLIHRALSTFTNAQSPSLRRKAEALTRKSSTAGQCPSHEDLAARLEEIVLKNTLFEPQRLKRPARARDGEPTRLNLQSQQSHLPSPEPTTASSSQEPGNTMHTEQGGEEPDDTEESSMFYSLDMDSLEHALDLPQGSIDGSGYDDYPDDECDAGEAVDWDDIEAWTEHDNEWLEYEGDDDLFEDIDSTWSPPGYEYDGDGQHDNERQEGADWLDVQDGQLEAALFASASDASLREQAPPWCEEGEYMDIDEMGLFDMGMEGEYEADEGIGMWRNEHEMIEHIL